MFLYLETINVLPCISCDFWAEILKVKRSILLQLPSAQVFLTPNSRNTILDLKGPVCKRNFKWPSIKEGIVRFATVPLKYVC